MERQSLGSNEFHVPLIGVPKYAKIGHIKAHLKSVQGYAEAHDLGKLFFHVTGDGGVSGTFVCSKGGKEIVYNFIIGPKGSGFAEAPCSPHYGPCRGNWNRVLAKILEVLEVAAVNRGLSSQAWQLAAVRKRVHKV